MIGSRAGARRGPRADRTWAPQTVGLVVAVIAALVAWGALVWAAVRFGRSARSGDASSWLYLGVASVGAVACLFLALLLLTLALRGLGILAPPGDGGG